MIIDCVSDLHGHYPELEGGDLLIVAGDLTANDSIQGYDRFFDWLSLQTYNKKIYIAGNHDNLIAERKYSTPKYCDATYLCDSGTEFICADQPLIYNDPFNPSGSTIKKLKIWGSPWTKRFKGMNPKCMAFTVDTEEELAEKWALIPDDVDILITHSAPFTILDMTKHGEQVGSTSLLAEHISRLRPKLWIFGHIHEGYGQEGPYQWNDTKYVNASHVNERYEPVNKPIRVEL